MSLQSPPLEHCLARCMRVLAGVDWLCVPLQRHSAFDLACDCWPNLASTAFLLFLLWGGPSRLFIGVRKAWGCREPAAPCPF